VNAGLRLDKNDATNGSGADVGDKASWSPRLSAIWDPNAKGQWAVTGSYARYVMALTSNLAGSTTKAGNTASLRWFYQGSAINPDPNGALVTTDAALAQVFDWFNSVGGNNLRPLTAASVPGVNMTMLKPLTSPYSHEYSGGVSRTLGNRGAVRVDATYRRYYNFYSLRTDTSTGKVVDTVSGSGNTFDMNVVENTNDVTRKYASLVTQANYRLGERVDFGGNYTLSHAYGNLEGEIASGPSGALVNSYPEYKQQSWNAPVGDLQIDQRHRARMWATYTAPARQGTVTLGVLQQIVSGTPYGAVGSINPRNYVTNPGYVTPPAAVDYYYTARDAFHTQATYRTDLSANYAYRTSRAAGAQPEVFFHAELLNMFNRFQLCGCGASVFNNGGTTDMSTIAQTVTAVPTAPFDPFNSKPVENVNYVKAANFGQAINALAYTSPRMFRFSVGVRF